MVEHKRKYSITCCSMPQTIQLKPCRTLQSLRKLTVCLWKSDMCVCPAHSSFSSIFCLPGILSWIPQLPTYSAFLKDVQQCSTEHCFAFIVFYLRVTFWFFHCFSSSHHCVHIFVSFSLWKMNKLYHVVVKGFNTCLLLSRFDERMWIWR